jgi:hypothetical protein
MKCKICNYSSRAIFQQKILNKYCIQYYYCENCKFIQTEEPFWLEEAYSDAISVMDTGMISRNIENSKNLKLMIPFFIKEPQIKKFLDYGGGYGILVRLMRDIGYDFYWFDKYCQNIFAKGFEIKNNIKYELVTAFEVFEHLNDPINEIIQILDKSNADFLVFSTEVYKNEIPDPRNWWYYSFESGQHISFYNIDTLKFISQKFNFELLTNNINFHIFSKNKKSDFKFKLLLKFPRYSSKILKTNLVSKTFEDYEINRQNIIK